MGTRAMVSWFLLAGAVAPAGGLAAQNGGTAVLTVAVDWSKGGSTGPLSSAFVCVGTTFNPAAYGTKPTGIDGRVVFDNVPFGTAVLITASVGGPVPNVGVVQGKRVNYVAKTLSPTLTLLLDATSWPGPNCSTPVGQEPGPPPPVKILPAIQPALAASLKSTAGSLTTTRSHTLHTNAGPPYWIAVAGSPTEFQIAANPDFVNGSAWTTTSVTGGLIPGIGFQIVGGDGARTLYLRLRNAAGQSPVASVSFTFVDGAPCTYTLARATTSVSETLTRGTTKQHLNSGKQVYLIKNTGPHSISVGYHIGDPAGNDVGPSLSITVAGGAEVSTLPIAWNVDWVKCN